MSIIVLEVPRSVRAAAACPLTATVAVATDESITLYDLSRRSRKAVWMCEIGAPRVKFLALRGDLVAYATSTEVLAVSYLIDREHTDSASVSKEPRQSLVALCRSVLRRRNIEAEKNRGSASLALKYLPPALANRIVGSNNIAASESKRPAVSDAGSVSFLFQSSDGRPPQNSVPTLNLPVKSLMDSAAEGPSEVLQPSHDPHVVETNGDDGYSIQRSTLILYRRLDSSDAEETPVVHSLSICADSGSSVALFCSSARRGYLYNISKSASGGQRASPLARYAYTDDTLSAVASDTLVVAATMDGVHCFVRRSSTWSSNRSPKESSDPDPCVVSIQPYMSITGMDVHRDQVILLSKITASEMLKKVEHAMHQQQPRGRKGSGSTTTVASGNQKNAPKANGGDGNVGWTLYHLRPTEPLSLYDQMRTMAVGYKESHPQVYYMLLVEIHHFLSCWLSASERATALPNASVDTETVQRCRVLLMASFSALAEFFYSEKDYERAAGCWSRSDSQINGVLYRLFQILPSSLAAQKYVKNYLKRVMFDNAMRPLWKKDQDLGNRIFQLLHKNAPHLLGRIILESFLSGYSKSVVQPIMETAEMFLANRVPDDLESGWVLVDKASGSRVGKYGARTREEQRLWEVNLALCSLYSTHGLLPRATETLKKIPERFLVNYLMAHTEIVRKQTTRGDASSAQPRRPRARSRSMPEHEIRDLIEGSSGEVSEAGIEAQADRPGAQQSRDDSSSFSTVPQEKESQPTGNANNSSLSQFGMFLMQQQPWTMFEVLLRGFLAGQYSMETSLRFLEVSSQSRLLILIFLEAILLHLRDSGSSENALLEDIRSRLAPVLLDIAFGDENELAEVYHHLSHDGSESGNAQRAPLVRSSSSRQFGSLPTGEYNRLNFETAWKQFHQHVFLDLKRLKWLEKLAPFYDAESGAASRDHALSKLKGGVLPPCPFLSPSSFSLFEHVADLLLVFYIRKLAGLCLSGLLDCQDILGVPFFDSVVSYLQTKSSPQSSGVMEILRLVRSFGELSCAPVAVDSSLAPSSSSSSSSVLYAEPILRHVSQKLPVAYLSFAGALCESNPSLWSDVLKQAISTASSCGSETDSEMLQPKAQYSEMLHSVLEQAAVMLPPKKFLLAIPDEGEMGFYLPFIELSLSHASANSLLGQMKKTVQAELDNPNGTGILSTSVLYGAWKAD